MKVFVTKYALTKGIREAEVDSANSKTGPKYVYEEHDIGFSQYIMGRDAFLTLEEAEKAAAKMRDKNIAFMQKAIARLEKLKFGEK